MVMGTEVQKTSYLGNFHAMGDLKDDANGCWSQYFDPKSLAKNMNNENKSMPSGCLNYDKELFRRTILEHEAVFRKQVYELHRLYGKQKEMMDELKKTSCKPLQTHTIDSHILSSQSPGVALKDNIILDSKKNGTKRKTFDPELATKLYIGHDEKETIKEIIVKSSLVAPVAINKTHNLADSIESLKEICFGQVVGPVFSKFGNSNAENKEFLSTTKSCAKNEYSKSICYDEDTSSNKLHLHVDNKETNWEWSGRNNEVGQGSSNSRPFGSSSYTEKYPMPSANLHLNKTPHGIPPSDQSKINSWFSPNLENIGKQPDHLHKVDPFSNSRLGLERYAPFSTQEKFPDPWHSQIRVKNDPTSYPNGFNSSLINGYTDIRLDHNFLNGFLNGSKTQKINIPSESNNLKDVSDMQNNKKIFGFCIPEKVHAKCKDKIESSAKCEDKIESSEPKFQNQIDLNIDLNSSISDEEKLPQGPVPKVNVEAPMPIQEDGDKIKEAAENILFISLHKNCRSIDNSSSTLLWFADVVISSDEANSKEETPNVVDSFELMTLELEEIKPDKNLYHPFKLDFKNEEDNNGNNTDSFVFAKAKRGQWRRRRERRDFQSDILPSIASLSRKEVSEDIQKIGGLLKGVGKCWEGRNGNCRRRVGRRPKTGASSLLLPEKHEESGVIGLSWTTRRCRRP